MALNITEIGSTVSRTEAMWAGGGVSSLPDGPQPRACWYGFIKDLDGNFTVFQDKTGVAATYNPPRPVAGQVTVNPNTFYPAAVNNRGQAVGAVDLNNTWAFWDGTNLMPIDHDPNDLNDQGQVVGEDLTGYPDVSSSGYLWENKKSITFSDVLAYWASSVYHDIQPFSICNQVKAAPADGSAPLDTDTTIHILTSAEGQDVGKFGKVIWTRDNNGKWSFANIALPDGTTITEWTTINSSGVIAAIGNGGHALLLVPVQIRDIKDPVDQTDDVFIEPKVDDQDKNVKSIAWIVPHKKQPDANPMVYDQGDDPRMPELEVQIKGLFSSLSVQWKFNCKYCGFAHKVSV